jgi:predicted nucleotidyltransferase
MVADMALDTARLPMDRIAAFCRRHRIRRLALFGSALRDDFKEDSDVDVLVEFEPGARVGWSFFRMQDELSEILGRSVDLNTEGFLSRYFRDAVLAEARDLYVAASRPREPRADAGSRPRSGRVLGWAQPRGP